MRIMIAEYESRFQKPVVTIQSGFPFTPQFSHNPSNGDTGNPVRSFVNPNFTGPIIPGRPGLWFNPNAFLAPSNIPGNLGFYGNLGRDTLIDMARQRGTSRC
jgi:hypothetical protein